VHTRGDRHVAEILLPDQCVLSNIFSIENVADLRMMDGVIADMGDQAGGLSSAGCWEMTGQQVGRYASIFAGKTSCSRGSFLVIARVVTHGLDCNQA